MNGNGGMQWSPVHHVVASANAGNVKAACLEERTISCPVGLGNLGTHGFFQLEVHCKQARGLIQTPECVFLAECFYISGQCLAQVRHCFFGAVALAVGWDVRNPRRKTALFFIRNDLDHKPLHALIVYPITDDYRT